MRRYWEKSGEVTPPKNVDQGRPAILSDEVVDDLLLFLSQRPTDYLDKMNWVIWDEFEIEVSEASYNLAGITKEKLDLEKKYKNLSDIKFNLENIINKFKSFERSTWVR